jgi:hypothetical protein
MDGEWFLSKSSAGSGPSIQKIALINPGGNDKETCIAQLKLDNNYN